MPTARWMTGAAPRPQLRGWRPPGATTAPAAPARVSGAASSRGWGFSGPREVGRCRRMCSFLKCSLHKASLSKPRRLLFSISAADSPQPSINSPGSGFWNFPGVVSHVLTAAPRPVPAAGLFAPDAALSAQVGRQQPGHDSYPGWGPGWGTGHADPSGPAASHAPGLGFQMAVFRRTSAAATPASETGRAPRAARTRGSATPRGPPRKHHRRYAASLGCS